MDTVRVLTDRAGGADAPEPQSVSALSGAHPSRFKLKAYRVTCEGFPGYLYYANSRGKALRDAWYGYCNYRHIRFGEFLRVAKAWREHPGGDFGAPLTVDGQPAFYVSHNSQYVQIAWPDGDGYSCAHPLEIEPEHFRPTAYRSAHASSPRTSSE